MSIWIILSWVFVAILTAVNVVIFLKLKSASEQMLKMAFPNAKSMGDAMSQMQNMMAGMGMGGMGGPGGPGGPGGMKMPNMGGRGPGAAGGQNMDAQLKQAMQMLQNMQKKPGGR
ncbi:MAG: hypothetical protein P4M08_08620 [Oligoflexia bacterium]|nr:hypothetical protein [Oligoflexia bacterium]